jgi:DNA mismatch repair ATPase MutS
MKVFLMHPDRDFVPAKEAAFDDDDFAQDLELGVLLDAMAGNDGYLDDIARAALAGAWSNDAGTILYRQDILKDCLANDGIVRELYALALEPFSEDKRRFYIPFGMDPASKVSSSVSTLQMSLDVLRRIRNTCNAFYKTFHSRGFNRLFETLNDNLDDDYLASAKADLERLKFNEGVLVSADLGESGKGANFMLREPQEKDRHMIQRLLPSSQPSFTIQIHPRDEAGAHALGELQARGLSLISDALMQSAEHVFGFLKLLRAELGFYVTCLNLNDRLKGIREGICFPVPSEKQGSFSCLDLRDTCLALTVNGKVVGNDVDADGKSLIIVTGANRGGKSTFLRSVGLAQLMMQAGMFVTAEAFSSSLHSGLFSHYKREEDRSMTSGKFDEELVRMDRIAARIRGRALVLFNESFAATNEREGSEIAHQIVSALLERAVMVLFVSHMYEFARSFLDRKDVLFLRADRDDAGKRSFRLRPGKPRATSFGPDLYKGIFGAPKVSSRSDLVKM